MTFYRDALLGKSTDKIVIFTSSLDEDKLIVNEVIEVLIAHAKHLMSKGLIPHESGDKVLKVLNDLYRKSDELFNIVSEDVHEAIEIYLRNALGSEAGWLPLGRSRNDHVAAALRLKTKKLLVECIGELIKLRKSLLVKANKHLRTLLPLATHLQSAQISTVAHYLMYIEEMLRDFTQMLYHALNDFVDKSPLGSGAIAGTSAPLDRLELANLLGFKGLVYNTLYATSSRDFISVTASMIASLSVALSRIAEDFIIWTTPQFNYIEPPASHLATSSMMPHKKNLVTMEVLRAWGGESIGHLTAILSTIKAVPSGYNLDLQEVTKHLLKLLLNTIEALTILRDFIERMEFKEEVLKEEVYRYPLAVTDLAEYVSLKFGKPYREVHKEIASLIKELGTEDIGKICCELGRKLGVSSEELLSAIKPENVLNARRVIGSPNPEFTLMLVERAENVLDRDYDQYLTLAKELGVSNEY
ncbi:MAG: argininosuccinate lyase [Sulfolobales archaeon]